MRDRAATLERVLEITRELARRLGEGDAIVLDIEQEVSSLSGLSVTQTASDIITNERKIQTKVLAVDEACTNIIRHAYGNRHDQAIELRCRVNQESVEFVLLDRGESVPAEKIRGRPLEEVVGKQRTVPLDSDLLVTAKALGITFGD